MCISLQDFRNNVKEVDIAITFVVLLNTIIAATLFCGGGSNASSFYTTFSLYMESSKSINNSVASKYLHVLLRWFDG